jgi:hypothetical protein
MSSSDDDDFDFDMGHRLFGARARTRQVLSPPDRGQPPAEVPTRDGMPPSPSGGSAPVRPPAEVPTRDAVPGGDPLSTAPNLGVSAQPASPSGHKRPAAYSPEDPRPPTRAASFDPTSNAAPPVHNSLVRNASAELEASNLALSQVLNRELEASNLQQAAQMASLERQLDAARSAASQLQLSLSEKTAELADEKQRSETNSAKVLGILQVKDEELAQLHATIDRMREEQVGPDQDAQIRARDAQIAELQRHVEQVEARLQMAVEIQAAEAHKYQQAAERLSEQAGTDVAIHRAALLEKETQVVLLREQSEEQARAIETLRDLDGRGVCAHLAPAAVRPQCIAASRPAY